MSRVLSTAAMLRLTLLGGVIFCLVGRADAASIQVGSLLLPEDAYPAATGFDPGFGALHGEPALTTRTVVGAPVNIDSDVAGTSGDQGDPPAVANDDITLLTTASSTTVIRLGRFGNTIRAGGMRWAIDLTPLDSYLGTNSLGLTDIDIHLNLDFNDENSPTDIYLSYTDASQSLVIQDLSTTDEDIATNWTTPAIGAAPGDLVNGTHEVIALAANDTTNPHPDTIDLLPLFNAGVRELNLVFAYNAFWGTSDAVDILEGSGVFIETSPIPEPTGLILLGIAWGMLGSMRVSKPEAI